MSQGEILSVGDRGQAAWGSVGITDDWNLKWMCAGTLLLVGRFILISKRCQRSKPENKVDTTIQKS
jgi:hypothetical protein